MRDELTGLATRSSFASVLQEVTAEATAPVRLLCVSLDRFRLLNDGGGHAVGDLMLVEFARRLLDICPPGGRVSRVGGDEFTLVYEAGAPDRLPDLLLRLLAAPYVVDGSSVSTTASIGVVAVEPGVPASTLLQLADIALDHARQSGRNRISVYTPAMITARRERFGLEQSLRDGIGSDAFGLVYQPIVDIEDDRVVGYEALLRWTDPVRGAVPPGVFIPIAEATGLIVRLGRSVLEWACAEAAGWGNERTIAVNLSPAQFREGDIVATVRDVLAGSGLAPGRLELEVTEGMLLENTDAVRETMQGLCRLGVTPTLDDFGAGHAGLSSLGRFGFQKLKIDGSFVRRLGCDREADAVVEAILLLGRRLDLGIVAESVETAAQLARLRILRCRYVQGNFTGRPMAAEEVRLLS